MAFSYANTFGRLGAIGGIINSVNTYRGTTIPAKVLALEALFSAEPAVSDGLFATLAGWQPGSAGFLSAMQQLARQTLINDVGASFTVTDTSLATALNVLIAQMVLGSQSVSTGVVTQAVAAVAGNTGNAAVYCSVLDRLGHTLDNAFAEIVTAAVTGSAQSGSATAGQESVSFRGQPAASGVLGFDYPAGSGAATSLNCVDASLSLQGGAGQWLTNGSFETWTLSTVPDGWVVATGGAPQIVKSLAQFFDGITSLSYVGDGATLTAITQAFGAGAASALSPLSQYAFNLWAKVDVVPAAGVLEVALVDGSGTILQDYNGVNSAATFPVTAMTTGWVAKGGFLRTPRVLPAAVKLRVRLSTALSGGSTLFLDRLGFTQPTPLYPQGPYLAAFSGNVNLAVGDGWTVTVANNYAAKWQNMFDKLMGMKGLGLLLPSSGSPTIADALIA